MKQLLNQHGSPILYRYLYKFTFICTLFFFIPLESIGEDRVLPDSTIKNIFTAKDKKKFGINFNIFKAYEFTDTAGKFYCLLAEHQYAFKKGTPLMDSKLENFDLVTVKCGIVNPEDQIGP